MALALEVSERREIEEPAPASLDERIIAALAKRPLPFQELRAVCRVRSNTLQERIAALAAAGRIEKIDDGAWRLAGS
jgi:predicted Rossmann fold nucleotide-binding protein DprA/Smf involved in DNA uptake